jgi:hypothetical protein
LWHPKEKNPEQVQGLGFTREMIEFAEDLELYGESLESTAEPPPF